MSGTGYHQVVVCPRTGNLRVGSDSDPPRIRNLGDQGWGQDLEAPAWQAVRSTVDADCHEPGTHVATIHYDLDAWTYDIVYHVRTGRSLPTRIRGAIKRVLGRGSA